MSTAEALALVALALSIVNAVALAILLRGVAGSAAGTQRGLPVGVALPSFTGRAQDGSLLSEADAVGVVLLFLGASCRHCHVVARELRVQDRRVLPPLLIGVIDDPVNTDDLFALLDFIPPRSVFVDPERAIADRLGVPGSPFAYAIDRQGRVRAKRAAVDATAVITLNRFIQ